MKTKFFLLIMLSMLFFFSKDTSAQCGMMNMNHGIQTTATTKQDTALSKDTGKVVYTCPMHPEVTSDKPGTYPKCGMNLVKKGGNTSMMKCPMMNGMDKEQMNNTQQKDSTKDSSAKIIYTCTMHPDVQSGKPGKCPKCGMILEEKK
ncbi:MAG: hypothetical protein HY840_07800 [Bacteroidetes bacterium]|nr:hypothetical protein [Bacteroidota bacterium]